MRSTGTLATNLSWRPIVARCPRHEPPEFGPGRFSVARTSSRPEAAASSPKRTGTAGLGSRHRPGARPVANQVGSASPDCEEPSPPRLSMSLSMVAHLSAEVTLPPCLLPLASRQQEGSLASPGERKLPGPSLPEKGSRDGSRRRDFVQRGAPQLLGDLRHPPVCGGETDSQPRRDLSKHEPSQRRRKASSAPGGTRCLPPPLRGFRVSRDLFSAGSQSRHRTRPPRSCGAPR